MTTAQSPIHPVIGALQRRTVNLTRLFFTTTLALALVPLLASVQRAAAQTNAETMERPAEASGANPDMLRAYLQLQDQIRTTQQAIDRNRQEAEAAAAQNAQALEAMRSVQQSLNEKQTLSQQRADQLQSSNHLMLAAVIVFASLGLLAILAMAVTAFFQWRAVVRLESVVAAGAGPILPMRHAMAALEAGNLSPAATDASTTRLLGALDRLERRIFELEHSSPNKLTTVIESQTVSGSQAPPDGNGRPERRTATAADNAQIGRMLAEGQSLLDQDRPDAAMALFDKVLALNGDHAEALVRKGMALEQLRQPAEALDCYNRAIAADGSFTIAYLHKGGLFNRMERFSEAMECYEQALRTQENRR